MSSFSPSIVTPTLQPPDPSKHVNYTLGMVLGVDDFIQEFTYSNGRDLWLARDLIGYGTVSGLTVTPTRTDPNRPRVDVSKGTALSPRGELICVDTEQCAYLNDWLVQEKATLQTRLGTQPNPLLTLYVTLCYRECLTDSVPIPGEPCRIEPDDLSSLLKPSRVKDDFRLELRWDAPEQLEEDALRDFVAWLREIEVVEALPEDPAAHLQDFEAAILQAVQLPASPPGSPFDFLYGSPPETLKIPGALACEYLRVAFRLWTTHLRPLCRGTGAGSCSAPNEGCLLLAAVHLPLLYPGSNNEWVVDPMGEIEIDEAHRPYVIHLRMLQEWVLCGRNALLTPSDFVQSETSFDLLPNPGVAETFSRGDHTHGTPPDPIPPHQIDPNAHILAGDVTGPVGDTTVSALQDTPLIASPLDPEADTGKVLTLVSGEGGLEWRPEALPQLPDLNGDVTGPIDDNTVSFLQDTPLVASPLDPETDAGKVLTLVSGEGGLEWQPEALPQLPDLNGDVTGPIDDNTVSFLQDTPLVASPLDPEVDAGKVLTLVLGEGGLEWQPQAFDVTNLDGDVVGPLNDNQIQRLQSHPVVANDPQVGQVLTYVAGNDNDPMEHWEPADPPVGGAGNFVCRPDQLGSYCIVASGICEFEFNAPSANMRTSYNDLNVIGLNAIAETVGEILLTFPGYAFPGFYGEEPPGFPNYIVKLTPWPVPNEPYPNNLFGAYFSRFDPEGFFLGVYAIVPEFSIRDIAGRIMIEISEFEPGGPK